MNRGLWLAPVLTVLSFITAADAVAVPTDTEIHQLLVNRVERQKWATGIVVGIVTPAGNRVIAYGTVAKGSAHLVDGDTVFDVGSITKLFTALALTDMAQRGEIALDDAAAAYLPPGTELPHDGTRQITLADLATHTSGLPLRPGNLVSKDPDNKYAGYTEALLFRFLATCKLEHPIGAHYEYSNVGYGLLGTVLSHRAHTSYGALIARRITGPLGMRDTRISLSKDMQRRLAIGYSAELAPTPHWDMSGALAGAGSLRSTASDLSKLLQAILGIRKSSLAPALAAMTQTRRPGGMQPASQIALAWNILEENGREIIWKNGSVGGFRAFLGYEPKARIGVVALANGQTSVGADDIGLHILGSSFPLDMHIPRVHQEVPIDPVLLDGYVGRYRYAPTDTLTIMREGDRLFAQLEPGSDRIELFAEGPRDFFLKILDAQITFEPGPDGKANVAIWHQGGQDQRGLRIE